jgi:hypothetical protein
MALLVLHHPLLAQILLMEQLVRQVVVVATEQLGQV